MTAQIIIEQKLGARSVDRFSFDGLSEIRIGRGSDAHVIINEKTVSRKQGVLTPGPDGFKYRDLSLNGQGDTNELPYGAKVTAGPYNLVVWRADTDACMADVRRQALLRLAQTLELDVMNMPRESLSHQVEAVVERLLFDMGVHDDDTRIRLTAQLRDEAIGLGPLEPLLNDDSVSEIMVVAPDSVFVERSGKLEKTTLLFSSETSVRTVIDRIVAPLGRRVDESSPMVDARLVDGSRVNAIIPPLAIQGAALTIRKFSKRQFNFEDLVAFGSMTAAMAAFLERAVSRRQNIVISGGTGSGKTTLLNVLSAAIDASERIVTIEDAAELSLSQPHVVSLESRPVNAEGRGEVTIRDLVKNSLRMRPDRIIVGECRSGEALDMLQAMNTGHDGSLTTTHANSPEEAVRRLETLCLMSGVALPVTAVREQMAGALDLIVQICRLADGTRKVTHITEVRGMTSSGTIGMNDVFVLADGDHCRTGWVPLFEQEGER